MTRSSSQSAAAWVVGRGRMLLPPAMTGPNRRRIGLPLAVALGCAPARQPEAAAWSAGPPLPRATANNAVAVVGGKAPALFSFLGLSGNKTWAGIVREAWRLDLDDGGWHALPPVPGDAGRLAATAQAIGGRVYVVGGYTVAPDGMEHSVPQVDVLAVDAETWSVGPPMPIPVDDAVSGVWRGHTLVLVSGWHERDNVDAVQLLDTRSGRWAAATPIPGPPVFGHAGAVVDDAIVYCDGVAVDRTRKPVFSAVAGCWRGEIDARRPTAITWSRIADHLGPPRYRMAATTTRTGLVVFAGGSPNPYNFDGVGYDGVPSPATAEVYAYDPDHDRWLDLPPLPSPRMDHRGLLAAPDALWLLGGMGPAQAVTASTWRLRGVP